MKEVFKINAQDIMNIHNDKDKIKLSEVEVTLNDLSYRIYNEIMYCRVHAVEFPNKLYEVFKRKKSEVDNNYCKFIHDVIEFREWKYFNNEKDFYEGEKNILI